MITAEVQSWFERIARSPRAFYIFLADGFALPICVWLGFTLVYGRVWPPVLDHYRWLVVLAPLVTLPMFMRLGLYRAIVRFMGVEALFVVLRAVTVSAAALFVLTYAAGGEPVFAAIMVYWALATLTIGGGRMVLRHLLNVHRQATSKQRRAVIYGAGDAGVQLARAMQAGGDLLPLAFVDDNVKLRHTVIHGLTVYSGDHLDALMVQLKPDVMLLALPSASRQARHLILKRLEPFPVEVKTLPNLEELLSGREQLTELRDIDPADLLGRDPVPPREELLAACITDKVVMVSGAGGSIGSELCRQIVVQKPRSLVLYELTEFALYQVYEELKSIAQMYAVELVPVLGSVLDAERLDALIAAQRVETIYHAAAYKHVPLVEMNPLEGLRNNFLGTWCIAEAAQRCGVATFVLISTDKAVRPTNVMGASKRLAELTLQGLSDNAGSTRFVIVRFGNVLGSSGSVIPRFREQIASGGPVTVTHADITRYFMTIPEASQLVLQAGSMGRGGDVFVLDMGKPVRISDLAEQMIHLAGLQVRSEGNPAGDIEISYTGLRPGEKLYEELWIGDSVMGTEHAKILRAEESKLPWKELLALRARIGQLCERRDDGDVFELLEGALSDYRRFEPAAGQALRAAKHDQPAANVLQLHR